MSTIMNAGYTQMHSLYNNTRVKKASDLHVRIIILFSYCVMH